MHNEPSFSQTHKFGNFCIIANFVGPIYLQFPSLFPLTDVDKSEIKHEMVCKDYILRSRALLEQLIFNGRTKTKLAILVFVH